MGCADSKIHDNSIYSLLNENTKEHFRSIIAQDDIASVIQSQNTTVYPNCLQLSENGLFWTTIHFCCRFDSPRCLDYFLKKCYVQNMKQYLFFINQPTIEGFTCLHLCGIWNAIKCFILLLKYGGLNLALKDKLERSVTHIMHDYNRQEMRELIVKLQTHYATTVTPWNFQKLEQSISFDDMNNPSYFEKQFNNLSDICKDSLTKSAKGVASAQEQKLRQEKAKLQIEKQQLWLKISKHQKQIGSVQNQAKHTQKMDNQAEKLQVATKQQQQLTNQLKIKQQQVQAIKDQLAYLQIRQANQQILLQIQRAEKHPRKIQDTIAKFNQFKDSILKNKPNRHSNDNSTVNLRVQSSNFSLPKSARQSKVKSSKFQSYSLTKTLGSKQMINFHMFPQKIQNRYNEAKKQGFFIDQEFPLNQSSLGGPEHHSKIYLFLSSLVWLRPTDFLCEEFKLFEGIDPDDIKQGQLGVCYCLAAISALARNPQNIKVIFQFYDLQLGFYVLKFYTNGKIHYIVLDDYIPCNSSSKQPLFSKPIGNQIWVLLIQKAWAKIVGAYFSAQLMTPDIFLQELIGCPTYGAWFKNKSEKMKDIMYYYSFNLNYPIVLTTGSKKVTGIVNNHSYALLKIIQHNGSYIYKIRNPWGRFEWNGYYSKKSTLWTPQLQQKCQCIDPEIDDGIFFLSESQLLQAFEYYSIGIDQIDCKVSYTQISSTPTENLYFTFTIKNDCCFSLRITQPFKRFMKDKNYKYSPVIFQLGKIEEKTVRFIAEGSAKCYSGDKSVYIDSEIFKKYEKGQYFIRAKIQWSDYQKYHSAVLSIYCPEQVQIKRIEETRGHQLWKKLLLNFVQDKPLTDLDQNISFCMEWMKAQMICYSIIRSTAQPHSYKVKWLFNCDQLKNCTIQLAKASENTIQHVLTPQETCSIGTLDRILLSKKCHSGNVSIKSVREPI